MLNPAYVKEFKRLGRPNPEKRMQVVMFGGFALPIGLFLFGWTAPFRSVHWIVPTIAGVFCGFGIITSKSLLMKL
jgi:DHA1 family multidrug resistance protein-like MFS transporter